MVTLKEIAKECGVSVASVSKALNHASDIGKETSERIRETARRMGYSPNAAARTLKTNKSNNIGVLFEDDTQGGLTHEYFSAVLDAVKNEAEKNGYDITFISHNIGGSSMSFLEHCRYRRCDGVVIANVNFMDPSVKELVESDIPVVTIDYVFDHCSAVLSDNERGMTDLVEYLVGLGHRKIVLLHGEDTEVTRLRINAFCKTCDALGVEYSKESIIKAKYHDPKTSGLATRALLERTAKEDLPTCIIYPDDISLLGGVTELESHGYKIPEDISVAGYDGIALGRVLRPIITSLHQDSVALGTEAAKALIREIDDRNIEPQTIMVQGQVQPGGTAKKI